MDREIVRNVLDWYKHSHPKEMSGPKYIDFNLIGELVVHGYVHYEDLKGIPAADVVEVVRCKECIHYMPYDWMFSEVRKNENINDYPKNEIGCEWIDHHINPEGYCSYGERKNE